MKAENAILKLTRLQHQIEVSSQELISLSDEILYSEPELAIALKRIGIYEKEISNSILSFMNKLRSCSSRIDAEEIDKIVKQLFFRRNGSEFYRIKKIVPDLIRLLIEILKKL